MAEKEHKTPAKHESKKKRKPHTIITRRAHDGSFGHEHLYDDSDKPVFAGTSQGVDDIAQHMQDHFGGGGEQAAAAPETPEAEPEA